MLSCFPSLFHFMLTTILKDSLITPIQQMRTLRLGKVVCLVKVTQSINNNQNSKPYSLTHQPTWLTTSSPSYIPHPHLVHTWPLIPSKENWSCQLFLGSVHAFASPWGAGASSNSSQQRSLLNRYSSRCLSASPSFHVEHWCTQL